MKFFVFLLSIIAIAGCSKEPDKKRPSPTVAIAIVQQRDVPIYIDAIGQVVPQVEVQVRPQVQGMLIKAHIQEGALVKEGDILYNIDPRPFIAALKEAKSQLKHDQALLEIAEKTVERYKTVVEDDFISKLTYEQYEASAAAARAQVELDKASIEIAQLNLNYCNVTAPITGKISYFNIDVGNILSAYDPNAITTIRPFEPIDISFSLPQQYFEMIRKVQGNKDGWPFIAILPESPQIKHEGKTYFIDDQVDQNTGTIILKGTLSNKHWQLWPGEFVKVNVLYKVAQQAFVVPPGAILIGKDGPYLYTLDQDNKVVPHQLKILTRTEDFVAFESKTIQKGDRTVIDGQINIAPGIVAAVLESK